MRDCSTCKDSVTNRPELKGVRFEETPCANCKPSEPIDGHISYGSQFEHPSDQTWKILDKPESEYRLETFLYWLDAWEALDSPEQKIISLIVRNPGKTQAELAAMVGVSRQAVHKRIVRLRGRFPGVFK